MYPVWTRHLKDDPEEKTRFENQIFRSQRVLDRLKAILDEDERDIVDRIEVDPRTYEIPSWQFRQAHNNGYRQCLKHIKTLIDLDKQKPPKEED